MNKIVKHTACANRVGGNNKRKSKRNEKSAFRLHMEECAKCVKVWYIASVSRSGWVNPKDLLDNTWQPSENELKSLDKHLKRNIVGRIVVHTAISSLCAGLPTLLMLGVGAYFSIKRTDDIKVVGQMYDTLKTHMRYVNDKEREDRIIRWTNHMLYTNSVYCS